jgi:UTP-glucose-1-phosphate uridylyltransferase
MEEGQGTAGGAAIVPDRARAAGALSLASGMLAAAGESLQAGDFAHAVEESRNAIRMASYAVLLGDGVVVGTLEATTAALSSRHPGVFPLGEWAALEEAAVVETPGLYNMILTAMGMVKKTGEQEAREAIRVAGMFVTSAQSEMGL